MRVLITFVLGAAAVALGQVSAPQLGWVPDRSGIRPLYGIPASAAVGARVRTGQDFSRIAVSPDGDYVLAASARPAGVSVYTPESGLIPLEGAAGVPDMVALSPRGFSAALWFSSTKRAQVVTGLPNAPVIRPVDTSLFDSAPSALAISDDGAWLSVFSGALYALGPNGEINRLPVDSVAALAFFPGTHDLAMASAEGMKRLTGVDGFAILSNLLVSSEASLHPVAIAATADNRSVVLADRNGTITTVDIGSGAVATYDCGCQPEGLYGMGPSAFRLTSLQNGAIKLLDVARGEILFAPLAPVDASAGAAQ